MTYTVSRLYHETRQIAFLGSFQTEDEAKMCLANSVETVCAEVPGLSRDEVRELVDKAVREKHFELRSPDGQRDSYFYIDKE